MFTLAVVSSLMLAGYVESSGAVTTAAIVAEVSSSLKSSWCRSQQNVCSKLCDSKFTTNTCSATTLAYSCVCSDGTTPDLASYLNTIDYYTCSQSYSDCILAHSNDQIAQTKCRTDYVCGSKNPESFHVSPSIVSTKAPSSLSSTSVAVIAQPTTVTAVVSIPVLETKNPSYTTTGSLENASASPKSITIIPTTTSVSTPSASIYTAISPQQSQSPESISKPVAASASPQTSIATSSMTLVSIAPPLTSATQTSATAATTLPAATGAAEHLCKVGFGVPAVVMAAGLLAF